MNYVVQFFAGRNWINYLRTYSLNAAIEEAKFAAYEHRPMEFRVTKDWSDEVCFSIKWEGRDPSVIWAKEGF